MTKFKLKISGKNIEILQDGEAIGEGDDYKEVLAYVATLIIKEDIDDYEVWLSEKGEKVKLEEKDFDPKAIVKNSKKIKIDDDEDEDDEKPNRRIRKEEVIATRPRFVYTPKNTYDDYVRIGERWKTSILGKSNSNETREIKEVKEEQNDSKTQS